MSCWPPARTPASAPSSLAANSPPGGPNRPADLRRPVELGDRRRAVHQPVHGPVAPAPGIRRGRHRLAQPDHSWPSALCPGGYERGPPGMTLAGRQPLTGKHPAGKTMAARVLAAGPDVNSDVGLELRPVRRDTVTTASSTSTQTQSRLIAGWSVRFASRGAPAPGESVPFSVRRLPPGRRADALGRAVRRRDDHTATGEPRPQAVRPIPGAGHPPGRDPAQETAAEMTETKEPA